MVRSPQLMLPPEALPEDGTCLPFDMSVWPPTKYRIADGSPPTLSWMYMPLIMDALGRPDVPSPSSDLAGGRGPVADVAGCVC